MLEEKSEPTKFERKIETRKKIEIKERINKFANKNETQMSRFFLVS